MPGKIVKDLSASTAQVVINQVLGLFIFYISSRFLDKELFGELNWALAVSSVIITAISGGIDLLIIRKIAAGENIQKIAGLHIVHVVYTGLLTTTLALVSSYFLNPALPLLLLLPGILISQIISYFSLPLKQIAAGKRLYSKLAVVSIISNLTKTILFLLYIYTGTLTIQNLQLIFIISAIAELLVAILLLFINSEYVLLPLKWNKNEYRSLLKEALPQYGVTIFNILLARFDWILIGILSSTLVTAEYSFAYKAFEFIRLPLLIISPLLLPMFTNLYKDGNTISLKRKMKLHLLFRIEIVVSALLPILIISCWSPLVDEITNNKYGHTNESIFIILCICIPLQFATDFFWNICFARNQINITLKIVLYSGCANILLNLVLIPLYGGIGAAISYVVCFVLQLLLFSRYAQADKAIQNIWLIVKVIGCAIISLLITRFYINQTFLAMIGSILLYLLFCIALGIIIPGKVKPALAVLLNQKKG